MKLPILRMFMLLGLSALTTSCGTPRNAYLIVAATEATENNPGFPDGKRYLVIYTIEHNGVTIKAHCELYDPKNHCAELRAGNTYDFKRDDDLRFLTLGQDSDNTSVVLGIDEEHMH